MRITDSKLFFSNLHSRILHTLFLAVSVTAINAPYAFANHDAHLEAAPFIVKKSGVISNSQLDEASGITASNTTEDLLWAHNDRGGLAELFAMDLNGRDLGRLTINGVKNRDWEDLAAFTLQGEHYLVIADVGNNKPNKRSGLLHFISEPSIDTDTSVPFEESVDVLWTIKFAYPDKQYYDTEAVAIDVDNETVLLLTKSESIPLLFSLPIRPESDSGKIIASPIGILTNMPRPNNSGMKKSPKKGYKSSRPTSMDISGNEMLVLNSRNAYLYTRKDGSSWAAAIKNKPQIISLPKTPNMEAISFDKAGVDAFVTSERRRYAPIYRLQRE